MNKNYKVMLNGVTLCEDIEFEIAMEYLYSIILANQESNFHVRAEKQGDVTIIVIKKVN